jgi:Integrase zinc binding domain
MANVLHGSILSIISQSQCNTIVVGGKFQFDYIKDTKFKKMYKTFKKQNMLIQGNVRVSELICVPKQDKKIVLEVYHEKEKHIEGNKLVEWMGKSFYWNDLRKDCKRYIETCQQCQANKSNKTKPARMLHLLPVPD